MPLRRGQRKRRPADFDWKKSADIGAKILEVAEVPYVLIGRVATWSYIRPEAQGPTKDVDFAIAYRDVGKVISTIEEMGYSVADLDKREKVPGYKVRSGDVRIDFIHGHPQMEMLILDAVENWPKSGDTIAVGEREIPTVGVQYLVAMKLLAHRAKDIEQIRNIVAEATVEEYKRLRKEVEELIGFGSGNQLDRIAREIGHPGPGQETSW